MIPFARKYPERLPRRTHPCVGRFPMCDRDEGGGIVVPLPSRRPNTDARTSLRRGELLRPSTFTVTRVEPISGPSVHFCARRYPPDGQTGRGEPHPASLVGRGEDRRDRPGAPEELDRRVRRSAARSLASGRSRALRRRPRPFWKPCRTGSARAGARRGRRRRR